MLINYLDRIYHRVNNMVDEGYQKISLLSEDLLQLVDEP